MTESCAPLIVNAALTGMVPTKADTPHVPVTPTEIAADAARCVAAGASIVHLHARDESGAPTYRRDVYARIVEAVRFECPDVVVCVSTSGRTFKTFEERADVLDLEGDLRPEMASLTLGSLNFPKQASVNDPRMIRRLAERMAERGIVPELEIFDLGMVDYAVYLLERGILMPPLYANILLGNLGTLAATPFNLATVVGALPGQTTWAAAGIGRFQLAVNSLAIAMGGNVRVGLEDNIWFDEERTELADNASLVRRVVRISAATGRPPASAEDARRLIGLPTRTISTF